MKLKYSLPALLFLSFSFSVSAQPLTARILFDKMLHSIDNTKTYSFNYRITERLKEQYKTSEYIIHMNSKPVKIFAYVITPNPGARVLFIPGENNDKIYIKPNKFPYINLNLSPQNKLMRRSHYFTMNEVGFNYLKDLLSAYFNRDSVTFMKWMRMGNETTFKCTNCYTLILENNSFAYVNYYAQQGETISFIAKKLHLNDKSILLKNPHISGYEESLPAGIIKVPNTFAKKIVLYLDKNSHLPIVQEMYDDKGMFARIEMTSVVQNAKFDADEFTRTKKEYGF